MSERSPRTRTWMFALLAVIVAVVVIAVIAVFTRGAPTAYPADSPEGVVQRYSQAVVDGDIEGAKSYLTDDVADSCDRVTPDSYDKQVSLVRTTEHGDTATVEVIITVTYESGPLGGGQYDSRTRFELESSGAGWAISLAPWELAVCANGTL